MDVPQLIERARAIAGCTLLPPRGIPAIAESHTLPNDLAIFYRLCGGMALFVESEYPITLVSPDAFVLANPLIVGELCEYDISSSWYILSRDRNNEALTIDLHPGRLGRCYDSFYERHGVRGSCPIIARSFTEFLSRILDRNGGYYYWLQSDFISLGDAYD